MFDGDRVRLWASSLEELLGSGHIWERRRQMVNYCYIVPRLVCKESEFGTSYVTWGSVSLYSVLGNTRLYSRLNR